MGYILLLHTRAIQNKVNRPSTICYAIPLSYIYIQNRNIHTNYPTTTLFTPTYLLPTTMYTTTHPTIPSHPPHHQTIPLILPHPNTHPPTHLHTTWRRTRRPSNRRPPRTSSLDRGGMCCLIHAECKNLEGTYLYDNICSSFNDITTRY
jgi:hypothetical protein